MFQLLIPRMSRIKEAEFQIELTVFGEELKLIRIFQEALSTHLLAFPLHARMQLVDDYTIACQNLRNLICIQSHCGIRFCFFVMQNRAHPNVKTKAANGNVGDRRNSTRPQYNRIPKYVRNPIIHKMEWNGMKWPNSTCSRYCLFVYLFLFFKVAIHK